jgi:hypothetical protein
MPRFFGKLIAPRTTFAIDRDTQQRAMMVEHFAYFKSRLDGGNVIVLEPGARSLGSLWRRRHRGCGRSRGARLRRCRSGDQIQSRVCLRSLSAARGHARSNNKRVREASYG